MVAVLFVSLSRCLVAAMNYPMPNPCREMRPDALEHLSPGLQGGIILVFRWNYNCINPGVISKNDVGGLKGSVICFRSRPTLSLLIKGGGST